MEHRARYPTRSLHWSCIGGFFRAIDFCRGRRWTLRVFVGVYETCNGNKALFLGAQIGGLVVVLPMVAWRAAWMIRGAGRREHHVGFLRSVLIAVSQKARALAVIHSCQESTVVGGWLNAARWNSGWTFWKNLRSSWSSFVLHRYNWTS